MTHGGKRGALLLFIGDIATFAASLWLTLLIRYHEVPSNAVLTPHLVPFGFLFVLWAVIFYLSGLYGKRIILFKARLPNALFKTQVFNIILAALFFFFVPSIGIAPKTNLVLYLIVSLLLIFFWRLTLYPWVSKPRARTSVAIVAPGPEAEELRAEVNGNPRYPFIFRDNDPAALHVAFEDVYEEVFDRVPLSLLTEEWFLKNVSTDPSLTYLFIKRVIDIIGAFAMALVTLIALPFVYIADLLEGPGPLLITQVRMGERGAPIKAYKFRSMTKNLAASGEWTTEGENKVTRVGNFLRLSSLDEFPQWVNVLKGEISLIGPRSDIEGLGKRLAEAIPYYNARYLVPPGITGWAQINQQYEQGSISPQSIEETKTRLAYDFYYLKHRSLGLDIVIALKTLKRMLFRVSSW
jgi:lipopolysaccharide/colanic/teichoic acid biosynthesis glycosyltransferase